MAKNASEATPTKEAKRRRSRDWPGRFLAALARTGIVKAACDEAGVERSTAYRRKATNGEFAELWTEAVDVAVESLEIEARRRAHDGVEKPVFYQGSQCGSIREYSDTLLMFSLKALRPEKYRDAAPSTNVYFANEDRPADPGVAAAALAAAAEFSKGKPSKPRLAQLNPPD